MSLPNERSQPIETDGQPPKKVETNQDPEVVARSGVTDCVATLRGLLSEGVESNQDQSVVVQKSIEILQRMLESPSITNEQRSQMRSSLDTCLQSLDPVLANLIGSKIPNLTLNYLCAFHKNEN